MGFELLGAAEQFGTARPALVDAFGLGVGVLTGERALGAGPSQYVELLRVEFLAPLVVAQLQLGTRQIASHASTLARGRSAVSHAGSIPSSRRFSALTSPYRMWSFLTSKISS